MIMLWHVIVMVICLSYIHTLSWTETYTARCRLYVIYIYIYILLLRFSRVDRSSDNYIKIYNLYVNVTQCIRTITGGSPISNLDKQYKSMIEGVRVFNLALYLYEITV